LSHFREFIWFSSGTNRERKRSAKRPLKPVVVVVVVVMVVWGNLSAVSGYTLSEFSLIDLMTPV